MKDNKDEKKTLFQAIDAVDDETLKDMEKIWKREKSKPQTAIKI